MAYKRLGDLLIAAGTITPEELDMGLQRQKETKERLGAALISAGIITEAELIEALRLQLGIEYIDLSYFHGTGCSEKHCETLPGSAGPHGAGRALSGHERPYELLCDRGS